MISVELFEPVLQDGIRNPNFFNGRLLTAEDLQDLQRANRSQHRQLAQAIGEGVVAGLEVSVKTGTGESAEPVVVVRAGLAFNRSGDAVALARDVDVALVRSSQQAESAAGMFAECVPRPAQEHAEAPGLYVLSALPASGAEGHAPRTELGAPGAASACAARYATEGVKFRLAALRTAALPAGSLLNIRQDLAQLHDQLERQAVGLPSASDPLLSKFRNLAAYVCFGVEDHANFALAPLRRDNGSSNYLRYGPLDAMRELGALCDCEVPLALLYWSRLGVRFVDLWSVRRSPASPLVAPAWPFHAGARRMAEAQAMFLQFQEQLHEMELGGKRLALVRAKEYFRFLPPGGYVSTAPGTFSIEEFFRDLDFDRVPVDRATLRRLIRHSLFLEPIDLASAPPILLYEGPSPAGYVLFLREEVRPEVAPAPPAAEPPPAAAPRPGKMEITLAFDKESAKSDKLQKLLEQAKLKVDQKALRIFAEDQLTGIEYDAELLPAGSSTGSNENPLVKSGSKFLLYARIRYLPAGGYLVQVNSKILQDASQEVTVREGETRLVQFELSLRKKAPDKKPPDIKFDAAWIKPLWFEKMVLIRKLLKYPWPPPQWKNTPPLPLPPDPPVDWLRDWAPDLRKEYPRAPIDPGEIKFYLDPKYDPNEIAYHPYAFAVFGRCGAFVPLILTPKGGTFPPPVPTTRAKVGGLTAEGYGRRLEEYGLDSLDALAAAWTGLVQEAIGRSESAAVLLLNEARSMGASVSKSPLMVEHFESLEQEALAEAGVKDVNDLANADPKKLAGKLKPDSGISEARVYRAVEAARMIVPSDVWSLESDKLGLSSGEINALKEKGVTTAGEFRALSAQPLERAKLEAALGGGAAAAARVDSIATSVDTTVAEAEAQRDKVAPSTTLREVTPSEGRALAELGVSSVHDVATADVQRLATAFAGDVNRATVVRDAALARLRPR
jgi:hypothetical protein